ncbi:hypothetical protein A3K93_01175 [Acinetobacter sp. NCu2D-2]|uniref:hypothetical protein n=1 Tax=Acinetobacter sp. NCu2D-2 TaxID=1608473 RepID=UPI0007CDB0E0|nr:hypothetical protein [Acinetobacter sp. NCu2D-2]ANF80933.1 hypothetical protein A3K93_01175 [Acinetobacter sp. NCu2D-2]
MKKFLLAAAISGITLTQTGCSAVMAAKQPPKKNISVMASGMPRSAVLAEIGAPIASEIKAGKRIDVYSFNQGYSTANRVSRTLFHGLADVATVGLWEIIATPAEAAFDGKKTAFEVTYDDSDKVEKVIRLQ